MKVEDEDKRENSDVVEYHSLNSEVSSFEDRKELPESTQAPPRFSFRSQLKKTLIYFIIVFLFIWLLFFVGRSFVDSIFDRIESNKVVHQDETKISSAMSNT